MDAVNIPRTLIGSLVNFFFLFEEGALKLYRSITRIMVFIICFIRNNLANELIQLYISFLTTTPCCYNRKRVHSNGTQLIVAY